MYQFSTYINTTEQNDWSQIFFGKTVYESTHKISVHANKVFFTLAIGDEFNGISKDFYLNIGTGKTNITTATLIDLTPNIMGIRCGVKIQETSSGDILYYVYCKNNLNMIGVPIKVIVHTTGNMPSYIKITPQEPFDKNPTQLIESSPQGELITRTSNKRTSQSVSVVITEAGTYKLATLKPTNDGTSTTLTLLINRRSGAVSSNISWIVTARCYLKDNVYTGDIQLISLERDDQPSTDYIGYKIIEDGMEIYFEGKTAHNSIYYQVLSFDKSSSKADITLDTNPLVSHVELDKKIGGKTLFKTNILTLESNLSTENGGTVTETRHGNMATITGNISGTFTSGMVITIVNNNPMHNIFIPAIGLDADGLAISGMLVLYTTGFLKTFSSTLNNCISVCFNATYNIK